MRTDRQDPTTRRAPLAEGAERDRFPGVFPRRGMAA